MNPTSESKISGIALVLAALVLAPGITACGSFASRTLSNAKVAVNTALAQGLAECIVPEDQATWSISDSLSGRTKEEVSARDRPMLRRALLV